MRAPTKSLRFEVFKRDSFTCQYCGRKAPEVVLHCDHVEPFAAGGETTIMNLVTACQDCNSGKGDRRLSDDAAVTRQHAQAELLQQRREQLEMMAEWQRSLADSRDAAVNIAADTFLRETGYSLNARGLETVRKPVVKYGLEEVCDAIRTARSQYVKLDSAGKAIHETVEFALGKIAGICRVREEALTKPYIHAMLQLRALVLKRFSPDNAWQVGKLLEEAFSHPNSSRQAIEGIAKDARWYTQWKRWMEDYITELAA